MVHVLFIARHLAGAPPSLTLSFAHPFADTGVYPFICSTMFR